MKVYGPQRFYPPASGLGALGNLSEHELVPVGTRLRLQANVIDALGVRAFFLLDNQLDKLSAELRKGGYQILKRTSSYSRVTYEVEVGIAKVNMMGVLQDFTLSFPAAGIGGAANVTYDVLWHPASGTPPPPTNNTDPISDKEDTSDEDDGAGPDMTTVYLILAVVVGLALRR